MVHGTIFSTGWFQILRSYVLLPKSPVLCALDLANMSSCEWTLCPHSQALTPSRKLREGLADVLSMHEMLTNQILLFNFETVATPWLQYVRPILVQF